MLSFNLDLNREEVELTIKGKKELCYISEMSGYSRELWNEKQFSIFDFSKLSDLQKDNEEETETTEDEKLPNKNILEAIKPGCSFSGMDCYLISLCLFYSENDKPVGIEKIKTFPNDVIKEMAAFIKKTNKLDKVSEEEETEIKND